jgi:beta-lactamase superfamily II metal-dependent hydrolase
MKRSLALLWLVLALFAGAAHGGGSAGTARNDVLTVEFLDVGQGDSALIRTPDGKVALVDAGTPKGVLAHLEKRKIETIDLLVTSHHHADHIGGSAEVIEEYEPRAYLDSGSEHTSKTYKRVLQALKASDKTKVLYPRPDKERKIKLGSSVVVRVFPQPPEDEDNENNNSIGLRVEYKDFSVVLTGDSEDDERAWWRKHADESLYSKVTVLKIAHHGSHNGTDAAWLKAASPELAVVSCGEGNNYGHPHKKTLDLLADQNVRLKRTDQEGTVTIKTNGADWSVARSADGPRRARLFPVEIASTPSGWYDPRLRPSRVASPATRSP